MAWFAGINVSRGSVATYARRGGIFNMRLTANLLRNLSVEKFYQLAKIWPNYGHESVAPFFGPRCIYYNRIEVCVRVCISASASASPRPHHYLANSRAFQDLALRFLGHSRTKLIFQNFPGPGNFTNRIPWLSRRRGNPACSKAQTWSSTGYFSRCARDLPLPSEIYCGWMPTYRPTRKIATYEPLSSESADESTTHEHSPWKHWSLITLHLCRVSCIPRELDNETNQLGAYVSLTVWIRE